MHKDNKIVIMTIPVEDPEKMDKFQELMNKMADAQDKYIQDLAAQLNVSLKCANDVAYLRTRSQWTQELENTLIQRHKDGLPVNVYTDDFFPYNEENENA